MENNLPKVPDESIRELTEVKVSDSDHLFMEGVRTVLIARFPEDEIVEAFLGLTFTAMALNFYKLPPHGEIMYGYDFNKRVFLSPIIN